MDFARFFQTVLLKRSFLPGIFGLSLFIVVQSCSNGTAEKRYKIGFSQCGDADKWRKSMLTDMNRELAFHPELKLLYKQADDNSQKQVEQVKELLSEGIDLLIISPNEAEPL